MSSDHKIGRIEFEGKQRGTRTRDWDPGWLKEIIADALSERVMPIPRCDTCKWWEEYTYDASRDELGEGPSGEGWCRRVGSDCDGIAVVGTRVEPQFDDKGRRTDERWFQTKPDFGCVQWEGGDE